MNKLSDDVIIDFAQRENSNLAAFCEMAECSWPKCAICGRPLRQDEDFLLDNHYPYYSNYNRCHNHLDIPIGRSNEDFEGSFHEKKECLMDWNNERE